MSVTPTPAEWIRSLEERPEGYAELLEIHRGDLAVASWALAHVRLQAVCHPGPPCAGDLLAACLTISEHAGVTVPGRRSLARDAAQAGYEVSGL